MTNRLFLSFLFLVFFLSSCENSTDDDRRISGESKIESFLKTNRLEYTKQNGVYYATRIKGFGNRIAPNDSIAFWYIGYTLDGDVFDTNILEIAEVLNLDTSVREFEPLKTIAGTSNFIEGLNRGLMLCRENEWGTVLFTAELGFQENSVGTIPPWSPLAYDIFIIYVKNQQIFQEQNFINNFVASSQGFTLDTIGFWINVLEHTENDSDFTIGDTLYVKYQGQSLHNSNAIVLPTESKEVILNKKNFIEGVLYGFLRLSKGEQAQLVLPSCLAFGILGNDSINPYEPMLYNIMLDSIKTK
ncbi:MAG: FKBP-type peptidyl-prolyl cis-trans isomerase [Bacteroidales bacterium]|jgi:FKBP-type peptidyl-prolyl cis-trans isomerase|nr:FKBP-type peptidyl-prolyl cis-trans isomerase [Bacteroidales bacterium]MDY0197372.1 FKBP-type peptidyl-prolyl cis-trans isomerase [Tenuifilaceae bacterium]